MSASLRFDIRRPPLPVAAIALLIALAGCSSENTPSAPIDDTPVVPEIELPGTVRISDSVSLAQFVVPGNNRAIPLVLDGPIIVGTSASSAVAPEDELKLSLDVEVKPPEVNGALLQATHIATNGVWVYVTYAQIGEGTAGAVDVMYVSPQNDLKLVSRIALDNTEYYGVTVANDVLYLVGASDDPKLEERAVLDVVRLRDGQMFERVRSRRVSLPSFAGTGVHVQNGMVWVTSGSGGRNVGGLTVLSEKDLSEVTRERFEDARAVHGSGAYVVVFSGTPGRARVYDAARARQLGDVVDVGGAGIPESKGTAWVEGDWAFLGAGDGGAKMMSLTPRGGVVAGEGIPTPEVAGVPRDLSTTNAVTTDRNGLIITASGETGVHIHASNHLRFRPGSADAKPEVFRLGRLDFGSRISANFVAGDRSRIFVASGLGGLKIVRIE